jgi:anti-sigma regulatory factor (Ser/Thr protein kinase)
VVADLLELPGGPMAPAAARHLVTDRLDGEFGRARLDDIALMVSELVTNGFVHGGARDGGTLRVEIELDVERARIVVTDPGSNGTPTVLGPAPDRIGGLGLFLVDQIADRWGVERDHATSVWFEVDRELEL